MSDGQIVKEGAGKLADGWQVVYTQYRDRSQFMSVSNFY